MAWPADKRARFQTLKGAGLRGELTEAERAELRAYAEELDCEEEAILAASFAQMELEITRSKRDLEEALRSAESLEAKIASLTAETVAAEDDLDAEGR